MATNAGQTWTVTDRKRNGYYEGQSCPGKDDDGITDCPLPIAAKGMCMRHYQRLRLTGRLELAEKEPFVCAASHDGPCGVINAGAGYCPKHYTRFKKHGDPLGSAPKAPLLTCRIVCQGIRCDKRIGRGHGDGINYKGSQARELCAGHNSRWLLKDGDTQDDIPIQPQHRGPDSERPRCEVEGCDLHRRGNSRWCSAHRQRVDHHGHSGLLNQHNIGLACSVEWCDKVCETGADRFVKGMCAECFARFDRIGTTEKTVIMLKRDGIYRTCSVKGCDGDETGDTLLCKRHWNQDYRKRPGVQAAKNAATARYRAKKQGANTDGHTIPELHKYWKARGIDPKRCTYCDAWYRQWRNNWQTSIGDHVLAIDNGGSDTMDNIVPCCITCNESKGARLLHIEWWPINMKQAA